MSTMRIRDLGYAPGSMPPGPSNSILDIDGLYISQVTVPTSDNLPPRSTACKGVTVICPRPPTEFYKPCRASMFCFNGNGEMTGSHQVADWGFTNTPIAFTNSLSLGTVFDASWDWMLEKQSELGWDDTTSGRHYGTPVVGETCDWWINSDFRETRLSKEDVKSCFDGLKCRQEGAVVQEGGTGTSSRLVRGEKQSKNYTVAALCQSNYGLRQDLVIGGIPVGKMLPFGGPARVRTSQEKDGSIVIVVATDGPLTTTQLDRMARHVTAGLCQVGSYGVGRNSSGDIFLALSTAPHGPELFSGVGRDNPIHRPVETYQVDAVKNECIEAFFYACAEAVEEAILNSMVASANGTITMDGSNFDGLPLEELRSILDRHLVRL